VKVRRYRSKFNTKKKKWEESVEDSYYLATVKLSAKEFCKTIQGHWRIENVNHNVRDVSFNEDKSRIRNNVGVSAILTSFSLNILRINNVTNISGERFTNNGNFEEVLKYKGLIQH
jgi:predicted transposase YbfD/YdcC